MKGSYSCGRHARTRAPVLRIDLHRASPVVRLQAVIRGWLLRRRLTLAGPGVLRRKDLVNDEDLFTCESKDRQYPLDYFAFEESGKNYWFNAKDIWSWMTRSVTPLNPYTKTPIPNDARRGFASGGRREPCRHIPLKLLAR
jgi:hypothetical protein